MIASPLLLLQSCEEKIRAGDDAVVVKELLQVETSELPRELRLGFANLCRRVGLINVGLKILAPVVQQNRKNRGLEPSPAERAEYAVLLQRTGAVQEALRILKSIDKKLLPQAGLLQSFCHFNRWEYAEALPLLKSYLASSLEPYQHLVGRVNLAAALIITNQLDEAEAVLEQNILQAQSEGHSRLLGNCHELRTQVHLGRGHFAKAEADLEVASKLFTGAGGLDLFFVQKWKAILNSLETGSTEQIQGLLAAARDRRDWESLREATLFSLKADFKRAEFNHLFFGTPFVSYRERIQTYLGQGPNSSSYILGSHESGVLDLQSGVLSGRTSSLKAGRKIHQVIEVLLRDFYRPLSLGGLFAELFPEDHFDVFSSPNRVHQLIWRTRDWLAANQVPVEIFEEGGHYSIRMTGSFGFQISLMHEAPSAEHVRLQELCQHYQPGQYFTSNEASAALGLSVTSFKRWASWGLERGRLQKTGAGPGTLYKIAA